MKHSIKTYLLLLLTLIFLPIMTNAEYPKSFKDIKTNENLIKFKLENGFTCYIQKNNMPENRCSMRLLVKAGSFNETDSEQGIAHFTEHMAFNGTKHFKSDEMVEYFQRLGMAFGADTNAHTSFDETVYKIDLPKTDEKYLNDGLLLLSDYAFFMEFPENKIDSERGVVLAEMLARGTSGYKRQVYWLEKAFNGTLVPERLPIGLESTLNKMDRSSFLEFYKRNYTPDNMALIIVGDIDIELTKKLVEKHFSYKSDIKKPAKVDIGKAKPEEFSYFYDPDADDLDLEISYIKQENQAVYNYDILKNQILSNVVIVAENMILKNLLSKENSPIKEAQFYQYLAWDNFYITGIEVSPKNQNDWDKALIFAENNFRILLENKISPSQFNYAKEVILNELKNEALADETKKSKDLSNEITSLISKKKPYISAKQKYKYALEILENANAQDAFLAFEENLCLDKKIVHSSGSIKNDNMQKELKQTFEKAKTKPVQKTEEEKQVQIKNIKNPSSKIVEKSYDKQLDIWQIKFANNVRLNIKKTDFALNQIVVNAMFGGGINSLNEGQRAIVTMANLSFIDCGLSFASKNQLRLSLSGKTVSSDFATKPSCFELSATTNKEFLDLQLKLLVNYIENPAWRKSDFENEKGKLDSIYLNYKNTPEGIFSSYGQYFITGNNPIFKVPPIEEVKALTVEEMKNFLSPQLKDGYLSVSIVGDLDVEETINTFQNTFGRLSNRQNKNPYWDKKYENKVEFIKGENEKTFNTNSSLDRAVCSVLWQSVSLEDIKKTRRMVILSNILDDKMRTDIREKLGASYSPFSQNISSDVWPKFSYLLSFSMSKEENIEQIKNIIIEISKDLANGNISQDELDRALKPTISQIQLQRKTNGYWLSVLNRLNQFPESINWAKNIEEDFENINLDEIKELAKQYLNSENQTILKILPKQK